MLRTLIVKSVVADLPHAAAADVPGRAEEGLWRRAKLAQTRAAAPSFRPAALQPYASKPHLGHKISNEGLSEIVGSNLGDAFQPGLKRVRSTCYTGISRMIAE